MLKAVLMLIMLTGITLTKQIILVKQNDQYLFKVDIGNLKINLNPILSLKNKYSWIKSQDCQYCEVALQTGQNNKQKDKKELQTLNNKNYSCTKTCFGKSQEQYGLKCLQTNKNCQVLKQDVQFELDKNILRGKLIQIKVKNQQTKQRIDAFQIVLVQKIYDTSSAQSSQSQQQQEIQQKKSSNILNQMGQYSIWGDQSVYQDNIVAKNNKKQISLFQSLKQKNIQDQIMHENQLIQIQFEETVTDLVITQAKFKQLVTVNHLDKYSQDQQFAFLPIKKGFLTLQTQNLILPQKQFKKMTSYLAQKYFSTQNNRCQFKNPLIQCQKSIEFDKIEFLSLELILNGISVGFPFKSLLKNCQGNKCQIKIQESKFSEDFMLGTFILDIFAIQFIQQTENIKLYRLNNQWGGLYAKNQKYKKQNYSIIWWIWSSTFSLIFFIIKFLFYLALFSLIINFFCHWRKIVEWVVKIIKKQKTERLLNSKANYLRKMRICKQKIPQNQQKDSKIEKINHFFKTNNCRLMITLQVNRRVDIFIRCVYPAIDQDIIKYSQQKINHQTIIFEHLAKN